MPTSILKMRGWRVCAHFELYNSDNQCLSTCIWCEAQQIRLILMKIWTDLTWNSVDNLIIRRAIWWTEALPDLWTGLATQCPAENTVIHESYWHMDVDRYTVYIIKCILYTLCQNLTQPKNLLNIISQKSDNDNSTKNLDQGQNEREVEIPGSCSYCRWHNTGAVNDNCKVGSLQTFPRKFVIGKRGAFDAIKNIMKYCEQQLKWSWTLSCNARYLAREYGLNGGSNLENAQVQLFKHCSALDVLTNHFSVNIWSICTDFAGWRDRRCDQRLAAGHSEWAEQTTLSIIHNLYRHHH